MPRSGRHGIRIRASRPGSACTDRLRARSLRSLAPRPNTCINDVATQCCTGRADRPGRRDPRTHPDRDAVRGVRNAGSEPYRTLVREQRAHVAGIPGRVRRERERIWRSALARDDCSSRDGGPASAPLDDVMQRAHACSGPDSLWFQRATGGRRWPGADWSSIRAALRSSTGRWSTRSGPLTRMLRVGHSSLPVPLRADG